MLCMWHCGSVGAQTKCNRPMPSVTHESMSHTPPKKRFATYSEPRCISLFMLEDELRLRNAVSYLGNAMSYLRLLRKRPDKRMLVSIGATDLVLGSAHAVLPPTWHVLIKSHNPHSRSRTQPCLAWPWCKVQRHDGDKKLTRSLSTCDWCDCALLMQHACLLEEARMRRARNELAIPAQSRDITRSTKDPRAHPCTAHLSTCHDMVRVRGNA